MSVRRLRVPGRYDQLDRIHRFVSDAAETVGLGQKAVFHCQLAVDEACTNIIEHGYGGEGRGSIELVCRLDTDALTIELHDKAPKFDPTGVSAPDTNATLEERRAGGYGIHFINKIMDQVEYVPQRTGNMLRLVKRVRGGRR